MKALVLGGGKGLGGAIAAACRNRGWETIELGSSIKPIPEGPRQAYRVDLLDTASVAEFVSRLESFGHLDRFYWCAGRILKGEFANQPTQEILSTIDINFRSAIPIVHAAWRKMERAASPCRFVTVSSSSGKTPRADEAVYVATKFAQAGFTRSLGLESKNPHVKVALILPGGMQTGFWNRMPHIDTTTFLNPAKVAEKILQATEAQEEKYLELEIPRGSL